MTHSTMTAVSRRTHSRTKHTTADLYLLIFTQSLPEEHRHASLALNTAQVHNCFGSLKVCSCDTIFHEEKYYLLHSVPVCSDGWILVVFGSFICNKVIFIDIIDAFPMFSVHSSIFSFTF